MKKRNLLFANASKIDITPKAGTYIAGAVSSYRVAEFVLDPLFAKALVVRNDERRICIVTMDTLMLNSEYYDKIKKEAKSRFGFSEQDIFIHCLQNHTAPTLGYFMISEDFGDIQKEFRWLRGGDENYFHIAFDGIMKAIGNANKNLTPVSVGADSGIEGRVAFNRRMVMRDGSISMPLGGSRIDKRSRHIEGPVDPELGLVCFRDNSLKIKSILVSFACHPVNVFPRAVISADWPGAVSDGLIKSHGTQCVPLVLNGPCGNINPWDPYNPDYKPDHIRMGRILAETAGKVVENIVYTDNAIIDSKIINIKLPLRKLKKEEIDNAKEIIRKTPKPVWADEKNKTVDPNWVYALATLDLYNTTKKNSEQDYEIHLLRIGDTAIVGWPGETFSEGALALKLKSPTFPTYIAHNTHFAGYIPSKQAFERGGYETRTANWSRFVPSALDTIVDATAKALKGMFSRRARF